MEGGEEFVSTYVITRFSLTDRLRPIFIAKEAPRGCSRTRYWRLYKPDISKRRRIQGLWTTANVIFAKVIKLGALLSLAYDQSIRKELKPSTTGIKLFCLSENLITRKYFKETLAVKNSSKHQFDLELYKIVKALLWNFGLWNVFVVWLIFLKTELLKRNK